MKFRLSALWMNDHLDVWPVDDVPAPVGEIRGRVWIGELSRDQANEILSRASCYLVTDGIDSESHRYCYAARRVTDVINKAIRSGAVLA